MFSDSGLVEELGLGLAENPQDSHPLFILCFYFMLLYFLFLPEISFVVVNYVSIKSERKKNPLTNTLPRFIAIHRDS